MYKKALLRYGGVVIVVLLLVVSAIATMSPSLQQAQAADPTSRDPKLWPFKQDSIWNMPLATTAQYTSATIQPAHRMTVDEDIIIMTPDAPLTTVSVSNASWSGRDRCAEADIVPGSNVFGENVQVPIPDNFTNPHTDGTPNNSAAILMPDGVTIKQTQPFHRCTPGSDGLATSQYQFSDDNIITGDGIQGAHGASKMSSLGGTLRMGELVPGGVIRHALKMNLFCAENCWYNSSEPDGQSGYRWPALSADSYASGNYKGGNSEVQMGSLLALNPSFDVNTLRTEPARILARALQNYGSYVVDDTAWDVYALETEFGPAGRMVDEFQSNWGYDFSQYTPNHDGFDPNAPGADFGQDIYEIFTGLNVVTNNASTTIGGGDSSAERRAPLAPPFETSGTTLSDKAVVGSCIACFNGRREKGNFVV